MLQSTDRSNSPRIDIVLSCSRDGRFLRNCVASVLSQTGVQLRILIVDDGSGDETPQIAHQLGDGDVRITVRAHTSNRGVHAIYNEGIAWVEADYCMVLDADDLLLPGALARAVAVLERDPAVVLVYGPAIVTADPEHAVPGAVATGSRTVPGWEWIAISCAVGTSIVPAPTALCRTRVLKQVGGYRQGVTCGSAFALWLKMASRGCVAHLAAEQAIHRVHAGGLSRTFTPIQMLTELKGAFDVLFAEEDPAGKRKSLQLLAWQRIAEEARRREQHTSDGEMAGRLAQFAQQLEDLTQAVPGGFWEAACSGLAGTTGLLTTEYYDGVLFRWAGPEATFTFRAPVGAYQVEIDTAGLRGHQCEYITGLWWNEQEVPIASIGRTDGRLFFPAAARPHPNGEQSLRIVASPLVPGADPRTLGTPIRAIRLHPGHAARNATISSYIKKQRRYIHS